MEREMENPYLIQRLKLKSNELPKVSVDDFFSIDYMGSSEFEFGALPASLKRACQDFNKYSMCGVIVDKQQVKDYRGRPLVLFAPKEFHEGYVGFLKRLVANEDRARLKESTQMTRNVTGKEWDGKALVHSKVDVWWDIVNDVFFAFGENIEIAIEAIRGTIEKKRAAGEKDWLPESK